jgi:hypothetical protein
MFIEDKRTDDTVTFDNITVGECFEYDGIIYLRMEDVSYSEEMVYNAVNLEYGIVEDFDCDIVVKRLKDTKIVIS